jgi:hypothetical protein
VSAERVRRYLMEHGVDYETHTHPEAYTTSEVAEVGHVSSKGMTKAGTLMAEDRLVMAVIPVTRWSIWRKPKMPWAPRACVGPRRASSQRRWAATASACCQSSEVTSAWSDSRSCPCSRSTTSIRPSREFPWSEATLAECRPALPEHSQITPTTTRRDCAVRLTAP